MSAIFPLTNTAEGTAEGGTGALQGLAQPQHALAVLSVLKAQPWPTEPCQCGRHSQHQCGSDSVSTRGEILGIFQMVTVFKS